MNSDKLITARCGLRTNGDIHIGNMFPILRGFILGKEFSQQGKTLKFIIMLVDLEQSNQKPFVYQTDKDGCHNSLAEHSEQIIRSFVDDLKKIYSETEVIFSRVSDFIQMKEVKDKIIDLYLEEPYRNLISVVCEKCHQIADIIRINNGGINYSCGNCGLGLVSSNKAKFALEHTFLGALENYYFKPDIHIIGKDHIIVKDFISDIDKGDNYLNQMSKYTFLPKKILTPLILGKDGGKMSKSNKSGLFLSYLKEEYGAKYLQKMIRMVNYYLNNKEGSISIEEIEGVLNQK